MDFKESSLLRKLHTESVNCYVRTDSAITLIALVVTIIVLLILAGVSLNLISGGDGILTKAGNAVEQTNRGKILEEAEMALAEVKIKYYEDVQTKTLKVYLREKLEEEIETPNGILILDGDIIKYIPEGEKDEIEIGILDPEAEDVIIGNASSELKKGSIVNYTPSGIYTEWTAEHSGYSGNYILASGSKYTDSETQTDMTISKWKVFEIDKDTGEVLLVPSKPTTESVGLEGADGYNNAVKLLNDACSTLYSDSEKGIMARSINVEDIKSVLEYDYTEFVNTVSNTKYMEQYKEPYTKNKTYPTIYASEKKNVIDGTENIGTLDFSDTTNDWMSGTVTATNSIQPYETSYALNNNDFISKMKTGYSTILLPEGSNTNYWLASRYVYTGVYGCIFSMRNVRAGALAGGAMFYSSATTDKIENPLFPVVSLNKELIKKDATTGIWSVKI